jgi:hypothetical protein
VSMRISIVLAFVMVLVTAVPVSAAGSNSGTLNCLPGKQVKVWTQSSVEVWHHWKNGWFAYYNPVANNGLRNSYTGFQSTWWSSSWSTTSIGSGATCVNG